MEVLKNLITRLRHSGVVLVIGFILIIYFALGFLYLQQGSQQRELEGQIVSLGAVLARPLPSGEKLQTEYEEVNRSLAPMTNSDAIAMLVGIARESGIDIAEGSGKFLVNPAQFSPTKVGGGSYQVLSFSNIKVQGDYDRVMAFIAALDSGETLETMVLERVATSEVEVTFGGEEGARRAEFRKVVAAVIAMMTFNELSELPALTFPALVGDATNDMGAFPSNAVCATDKLEDPDGVDYVVLLDKDGYLLYQHDIIADSLQTGLVNYLATLTTEYYYTCEADGTVRQFDGANVLTATEYLGSEESKTETVTTVGVAIYTKP